MSKVKKRIEVGQVLEYLCRYGVVLVFFAAALPKLANLSDFRKIVSAYDMLPAFAVPAVALFLPLAEVVLAVGLIFNRLWSKYLTIVLLLGFIFILGTAIYQGLDIDCGCFGPEEPEHEAFQGLRIAIIRDVVMILMLLYSIWYQKYRSNK